ncbi:hypothetical protein Q8G50_32475, partial [Klebsiella pneumoniae]
MPAKVDLSQCIQTPLVDVRTGHLVDGTRQKGEIAMKGSAALKKETETKTDQDPWRGFNPGD